ncbi:MAG: fluoride efflux transporter CrcB [Leptolyngbyaceae cyanobacterium SM2_5_2]|nr:fluoride efflux transporter CrcB [Leptolyngbyaceae cyanobacterium SM2_5_2]
MQPALRAPIAVGLGAVPGALSRYYLSQSLAQWAWLAGFPAGTLAVNLLGCFLLGLFLTLTRNKIPVGEDVRLLVATGFIGSLTTFSSYGLEVTNLGLAHWRLTLLYGLGSPMLGLVCLFSGIALAQNLAVERDDLL